MQLPSRGIGSRVRLGGNKDSAAASFKACCVGGNATTVFPFRRLMFACKFKRLVRGLSDSALLTVSGSLFVVEREIGGGSITWPLADESACCSDSGVCAVKRSFKVPSAPQSRSCNPAIAFKLDASGVAEPTKLDAFRCFWCRRSDRAPL